MSTKQEQNKFNPFAARPKKGVNISRMIAVVSGKGGVGKSMVTGLLGSAAQQVGFNSAILDADVTGPSIGRMFNITDKAAGTNDLIYPAVTESGLKVISANMLLETEDTPVLWRGPMIASAVKEFYTNVTWGDIDVMFLDMPPGTGDVPLTVYQSLPLDGIVIVTTPQDLVSMIVSKAVTMANQMDIPILGIIENMSWMKCPHCDDKIYPFGESQLEDLAGRYNLKIIDRLPILPELTTASDNGAIEEIEIKNIQESVKRLVFDLDKVDENS
ncbi:MAG: Mrp/NBP35 family ATP-binding protein [Erysipelothrix sp.]|nr:Mrp/NBP35 family ATP-binding protein [Erysipelothrix sp.]